MAQLVGQNSIVIFGTISKQRAKTIQKVYFSDYEEEGSGGCDGFKERKSPNLIIDFRSEGLIYTMTTPNIINFSSSY